MKDHKAYPQTVLIIPDTHVPFHDRQAFNLMYKVAEQLKPGIIILLGDLMDCYSLSNHLKNPERYVHLSKELEVVYAILDKLDSLGAIEKVYICGNHEDRMRRYLLRNAPDVFECFDLAELLALKEKGWKWIPYRQMYQLGNTYFTHDVQGRHGVGALRSSQQACGLSCVIGHTHRFEIRQTRSLSGDSITAASFGWLGSSNACKDYMHQASARDWHLGFGLGYLTKRGNLHLQGIPIIRDGKNCNCVVNGVYYYG